MIDFIEVYGTEICITDVDVELLPSFSFNKSVVISNEGGIQSEDLTKDNPDLHNYIVNLVDSLNLNLPKLDIKGLWFNENKQGDFNWSHVHPNCVLSGCLYINASPDMGNLFFEADGAIAQSWFSPPRVEVDAKTNRLVLFPSFLRHGVYPNKTKESRQSLAFNLVIE